MKNLNIKNLTKAEIKHLKKLVRIGIVAFGIVMAITLAGAVACGVRYLIDDFIAQQELLYTYNDTIEYEVRSGDTLWAISEICNLEQRNKRIVIEEIKGLNNLSGYLQVGTVLALPVYD